jgi:purine catabolism regulator
MLTVGDLAALPGLGLRVAAGADGLDREVRWVASAELVDPTPWLEGGELLLTTGLALDADPARLEAYVERLVERGVAGLGFGVGLSHATVPRALERAAARTGLPLLAVPYETPFVAITKAAMTRIVNARYADLERLLQLQDGLIELALERRGLEEILARVSDAIGAPVRLERSERAASGALRVPVGPDRPPAATLVAAGDAPLGDWERVVLHHAAAVIALEVQRERARREGERRLLRDLVEEVVGGQADERTLRRRLAGAGLDVADGLAVAFVEAPAGALADAETPAAPRDGGVAVLLAAGDDAAAERAAAELAQALGGAPAGVGRVRRTARELARSYEEAWYALEARRAADGARAPRGEVATVRDLGSLELLLALQDERGMELYAESVLGPVLRAREVLLPSLAAFVEASGRWSDAAAALGVHRHTLRHRIRRIERLTGRDLASARDRVELWLALKARELLARRRG